MFAAGFMTCFVLFVVVYVWKDYVRWSREQAAWERHVRSLRQQAPENGPWDNVRVIP